MSSEWATSRYTAQLAKHEKMTPYCFTMFLPRFDINGAKVVFYIF